MAILIVEHNGSVEGARLSGRVLIGRRPGNHVAIDHPDVSRIHAWIDTAGEAYCVTDAGSRTGTLVNGQRVVGKLALADGDRIAVGPASLVFRGDTSLPTGVTQLDFGKRAGNDGILFDCSCGAPLWISSAFAGRMGKCRFCGAVVQVPRRSGAGSAGSIAHNPPAPDMAAALPAATAKSGSQPIATPRELRAAQSPGAASPPASCGACQSPIEPREQSTACPACGLTFHADCWAENYGCSAYGCSQVNVLAPKSDVSDASIAGDEIPAAGESETSVGESAESNSKIPAGHVLLLASVAGLLLGLFTFGAAALLSLVATLVYFKRHPRRPANKVVLAAALLSAAGVVVGAGVSYVWWLGGGQYGST